MKKTIIVLIAAISSILSGCNVTISTGAGVSVLNYTENGIDFSEERSVGAFDALVLEGPFNVYYVQSDQQKVLVEGKENFVKKTIAEVSDRTLYLNLEKGRYENLVLRVTVYAPNIKDISVHGSGMVSCGSVAMPEAELSMCIKGSGDIVTDSLICKNLSLVVMGSGDIEVGNNLAASNEVELVIKGSGDIVLPSLQGKTLCAMISGSGDIDICNADVEDTMELAVRGSGDISVNGRCRKVYASTKGSGDIVGNLQYSEIEKIETGSGDIEF